MLPAFPLHPVAVTESNMPKIRVREGEPIDIALRKFKRICEDAGVFAELKAREYYEKPTWRHARERKAAQLRTRAQQRRNDVTKRTRLY